mmetsp:Transcript_32073/g.37701  ORF Transcript_32073/g.37701 Transcript_32073/m.37701 type:complete len:95 (+) Transcript_32073:394-678(+)
MGPPCDPETYWIVYNGSLYCNFEKQPQQKFLANIDSYINDADARWTSYYGSITDGPFNTGCMADCFSTTCNCKQDCHNGGYCGDNTTITKNNRE